MTVFRYSNVLVFCQSVGDNFCADKALFQLFLMYIRVDFFGLLA
jgi:hypothetical protein